MFPPQVQGPQRLEFFHSMSCHLCHLLEVMVKPNWSKQQCHFGQAADGAMHGTAMDDDSLALSICCPGSLVP